ncbi:MAG: M48 family metallopeptidase, partial [Clostridia bacterium]|nr:M48 family metallopeptidase [Clostridia bacterium]
ELCHMRHRDHSPAFYAEVERWLPDYRERERLLRQ